jgi:hypothetical protein
VPGWASTVPSALPPAASPGGIGIRLVAPPANAPSSPQGRIYIVADVAPGAVIHRSLQVSNATPSTASITLYAAAASVKNGVFLGAVGHSGDPLSTWTSVDPSSSDVPSGGLLSAAVVISVPSTAPPGLEYGVIWAETRTGPLGGIVHISRVGIRIYLSVGPGGLKPENFSVGSLRASRSAVGQTTVRTSVQNTGGWPLDLGGTLRLTHGPGGLSAIPLAVSLPSALAVGKSELVSVPLNRSLPIGSWHVELSFQSGALSRSAEATVIIIGTTPHAGWLLPAILIAVGLLGLSALVVSERHRRRRSRHHATTRQRTRHHVTTRRRARHRLA